MSDMQLILEAELESKDDFIRELLAAMREIYAIRGEDKEISRICNEVLDNPRFDP